MKEYWRKKKQAFFRAVDVSEPILNVLDIDEENEVDAAEAGLTQADANRIWSLVEELYRTGMHPGVQFCLRHEGNIVFNRSLGYAKGAQADENIEPVLMSTKTPVCQYSASKAVMAIAAHKLAEESVINILNPVAYYIPEFGKNGKERITIHQMLGHHGGFPHVQGSDETGTFAARETILEQIYHTKPNSSEGREQAYHAISSGFVVDELIRRTTGKTIAEYLDEKFRKPMSMDYFSYGMAEDKQDLVAKNYVTGMKSGRLVEGVLSKVFGVSIDEAVAATNKPEFMNEIIPSANLYATAEEMGRFYQMLLDDGRYKEQQILQPETVARARKEMAGAKLDKSLFLPMRYSPAFMLGGKPVGMYGKDTHHAFGHLGFANIFCWADPQRDISVALVTTGKPIVGNHIIALPKLLHTISSITLAN